MKNFPKFKRGEAIKKFKRLPEKERKIIEDYVKYVSITSHSQKRLDNNKRSLITFRIVVRKPLDKVTLKDLRDFLALLNSSDRTQASRNELKHTIKRFLQWKFKDWSKRFDNLKDIKLIMGMNEEKINASSLVKKEDIEKIMKISHSIYWKAFFMTLYESGLRPIEVRTLLWRNIKFDVEKDGISEINVYATKTSRARSVYVKEATFYLKKLKENSDNELVFPAPRDKTKPMAKDLASWWLKKISLEALGRSINPYLLRHSRATELYTNSNIPDAVVQKFLGHGQSMAGVYTHLSNKDVKEAVSKTIYKLEDLPPEKKHHLEKENEEMKKTIKKLSKGLADFGNEVLDIKNKLKKRHQRE